MDTRTGEIMGMQKLRDLIGEDGFTDFGMPVDESKLIPKLRDELQTTGRTKVGRNDPCPCGSGRKFKRCHMEGNIG